MNDWRPIPIDDMFDMMGDEHLPKEQPTVLTDYDGVYAGQLFVVIDDDIYGLWIPEQDGSE